MMHPIVTGLAATGLALLQVAGWTAMGAAIVRQRLDNEVALVASVLIGSGVTAFIYAVCAYLGQVDAAILMSATITIGALAVFGRSAETTLRAVWSRATNPGRASTVIGALILAGVVVLWVDAIVPPRDGDVVRYHLAHIRQIVREGRWVAISDYHYAFPFGWTMNFLLFEKLGIPIAAHVVTLLVWFLTLLATVAWVRGRGASGTGLGVLALIAAHPAIVKAVTTAHADLYSILVVLTVGMLIAREADLDSWHATVLGFAGWIGTQSRYQLVAIPIVATVFVSVWFARRRIGVRPVGAYALGATAALILSSPFYVVNYWAFGNPFWPLLVRQVNGLGSYANRVANHVNEGLSGTLRLDDIGHGVARLLTDTLVFPLPFLVLALCIAAPWTPRLAVRRLAAFAAAFAVLWIGMQPLLLPRFILFFVPLAALGLPLAATDLLRRPTWAPLSRMTAIGVAAATTSLCVVDIWYSKDSLAYVLTGDERTFHRATWYYPVYQWVNGETPSDARFLLIVGSGHSYYLDRFYRKAEPYLNGEIDWENTARARELLQVLQARRFDYVIYEARDWSTVPGGTQLTQAVSEAIRSGDLIPVKRFDLELITGRVRGTSVPTTVLVLRPRPASETDSQGPAAAGGSAATGGLEARDTAAESDRLSL